MDRIDILLSLSLRPVDLKGHHFQGIETSEDVRGRVQRARERQYERYWKEICNASVPFEQLIKQHPLTSNQQHELQSLSIKQGFSNRVQIKLIRLARTIADLKGEQMISDEALLEALSLRRMKSITKLSMYTEILTGESSDDY